MQNALYPFAEKSGRIQQLDGWRGISILCVAFGHLLTLRYGVANDSILSQTAGALAIWGVMIFFVISGYIITMLALRENRTRGLFSIRDFYIRRCFRIIPPYFLYLGCIAVAAAMHLIVQSFFGVFAAAAFTCNVPSVDCGWFAAHSWTLAFEEQFYVIFPVLFVSANRQTRTVFGILFVCLVALPLLRFLFHLDGWWRLVDSFAPGFSFICIGAVAAAYDEEIKLLSRGSAGNYISSVVGLLLFGLLLLDSAPRFPLGSPISYIQLLLNNVLLPVGLAWLIASSVHQSNYLTRALIVRPLLFVGVISYSLYLWQQLFTAELKLYISHGVLLFWPLMFLAAALSYYFIERPAVRLGKRFVFAGG